MNTSISSVLYKIEASFDEVGFITAATVTVEELTDEQLRTQTAR